MNNYFLDKLAKCKPEIAEKFRVEAELMSSLGVDSEEKQKKFWYFSIHAPIYINEMFPRQFEKIAKIIFENDLPINTVDNLVNSIKLAGLRKTAYPNHGNDLGYQSVYNTQSWVNATNDIYSKVYTGVPYNEAFDQVTDNWDKMQKLDYSKWLRYYQGNNDKKYKIAQYFSDNGGFIPNLKSQLPQKEKEDEKEDEKKDSAEKKLKKEDSNDARDKIEGQRARIVGRLNAAERLLASMDGQVFAGDEQEFMLKLLQDLKRKVQIANKIRVSSSLFEDYIYREANFLNNHGLKKHASFLVKIAQDADPLLGGDMPPPMDAPPEMPAEGNGGEATADGTKKIVGEFFDNLEAGSAAQGGAGDATEKLLDGREETKKILEKSRGNRAPAAATDKVDMMAQDAGRQSQAARISVLLSLAQETPRNIDVMLENAFSEVTIQDIVDKLEIISAFYKKREIARQLALVDIMMDKLGIASYFPSLGEATKSALDSNQYVSTRIEEILNKLRGSLDGHSAQQLLEVDEADLTNNPQAQELQQAMSEEDERAVRRSRLLQERRDRAEAEQASETPVEAVQEPANAIPQELAAPVEVQQQVPQPPAPQQVR